MTRMQIENQFAYLMSALIKKTFLGFLESFGEYFSLNKDVIVSAFKKFPSWRLLRDQLYNIGVLSVGVVAVTGASTGIVLAAQSFYQLASKGLTSITGIMVAKAMITELGPILTAFMVTGRVGAAMCAELGTMKVTEQLDAMQTMAVNYKNYLLAPRLIGGTIMVPLLTLFSTIMGIIGGYLISRFYFGMTFSSFFSLMPVYISKFDISTGMIKALIFGIVLVSISCYKGIKTQGGAQGVGKATTHSVVISYIWILILDFLITMALNSIYLKIKIDWYG